MEKVPEWTTRAKCQTMAAEKAEGYCFTVEPPGYWFHWNPTELEKTNPEKGFGIPAQRANSKRRG